MAENTSPAAAIIPPDKSTAALRFVNERVLSIITLFTQA